MVLDLLDREFSLDSVLLWIEGNKVSILNTILSIISFCYIGSESLATTLAGELQRIRLPHLTAQTGDSAIWDCPVSGDQVS